VAGGGIAVVSVPPWEARPAPFAHGVDAQELEPMAGELRLLVRRVDGPAGGRTGGRTVALVGRT